MQKRNQIILISIIVVLIIGAAFYIFNNTSKKRAAREASENLSSLIEAEESGSLSANGETIKQNLIASLDGKAGTILTTASMEIGYLPEPDERIMVFILGESVEAIEDEAINWLLSRGFSREDLCNLPVVFSVDNPEAKTKEGHKLLTNYLPPYCL